MLKRCKKIGLVCGISGLLGLVVILATGTAHPDLMFRILVPLSLLLIFVSLPFLAVCWVLTIRNEIKAKHYLIAALWGALGCLLLLWELSRIFA